MGLSKVVNYFRGSLLLTAVCLGLGAWLGWALHGTLSGVLSVLWIVLVLGVLEVSLSFDNAIVNATVLRNMSAVWRKRFLTWGILVAVFGMRIVFPLAIVAIAAHTGPIEALRIAATNPAEYERLIGGAQIGIAGFGGAFLMMVGLKFFFDAHKDMHWIAVIETQLVRLGNVAACEIAVVLLSLFGISTLLPSADALTYLGAGVLGLLAFIGVEALGSLLEMPKETQGALVRSGLASFVYLEVLDASFSFDGVIGAFALANNMFIIALGLGIGAMFVRSMTIMLVDRGTLSEYRYLEHGAFWAIVALAAIMLVSPCLHTPEAVTGLMGAGLIALSLWSSVRHNARTIRNRKATTAELASVR